MNKETAKNEIKKHLWGWNFKVQDTSRITDYDLMVNGNTRVKVLIASKGEAKEKRTTSGCDILAIHVTGPGQDSRYRRFYSKGNTTKNGMVEFTEYFNSPIKTMPRLKIRPRCPGAPKKSNPDNK